ncbi:PTS sugar transporter subunit IIB [Listeria seeligeri]|uniref:PTS sugar transporter subunit IIB n=1 Tax=Listeria seeligeri TaxID=1640 RepID=A0A7T0MAP3_LISSE|nr:PTS sugar transporter subunit IIB [Listeria seeligeri]EAE1273825.1 PTS sugar transporter subunit IIB [Listeria monocytogenes]MBF2643084.1 PTS sugar transporter subunit IIB [Listeria seeligeri]QPJ28028.1 PTS sugar transporter subunit IIB [Listeria seeligeri]QPL19375.1 PTS sugar transporter subunit IIB [Listeria seeligeri]
MSKKNIMLVCSAGMSTSLLVTKMQKSATEKQIDTDIFAVSASEADNNIKQKKIDVVLLGPQIRYMEKQFKETLEPLNIPFAVINMSDYGTMNGEKVLETALSLIQ